ncbi:hypothetical protein Dxin01_00760 [Deinococcus xinjiangensis]|uniref:Uncharacterized protein n=1 Tax=Deinococcus xinjiangensis TaxID=457454 RepID=A0ABP9V6Y6_9DEIO
MTKAQSNSRQPKLETRPSNPQRPPQHLWLFIQPVQAAPEQVEVTELIVSSGAGRSYQYQLPATDRQQLCVTVLESALKRCDNNSHILLHSPHSEYVRIGDRPNQRPPEINTLLRRHNLSMGLARRNNGVTLFNAYAEALRDHALPVMPNMVDFQLHTGCVTDGLHCYVGAVLSGKGRLHTWRNTLKGHNLTLSELHAVRWAFATVPTSSQVEVHNQTGTAQLLWKDHAQVLAEAEDLKPYVLKIAGLINQRSLTPQHPAKGQEVNLYTQHARLLAGTEFAESIREGKA